MKLTIWDSRPPRFVPLSTTVFTLLGTVRVQLLMAVVVVATRALLTEMITADGTAAPSQGLLWLIPFVGLVVLALVLFARWQHVRLLRIGETGSARVTDRRRTSMRVNERYMQRVTFSHVVNGKTYQTHVRTDPREALAVGDTTQILFDPSRPSEFITEALTSENHVVLPDGRIKPRPIEAVACLIAPILLAMWPL